MKVYSIFLIVAGVICAGLSIYAGWSLREMITDQAIYGSALASHTSGSLPVPPPDRFLGTGWFGILAPTILGFMAALALFGGWDLLDPKEAGAD